jgi:flagellar protein FliO/FliZ
VTVTAEPATRQGPIVESSWPLQPTSEPTPIPAPRPYRSTATEEPWLAPEPGARPRPAENLTGLAAELSTRLNPPDITTPAARSEPAPRPTVVSPSAPPVEPAVPVQNDHNLAEMAQQLEAALRRAPMPEGRPPVTDPLAAKTNTLTNAPARPAEARPPLRDYKLRVDPKLEPKFDIKSEPHLEPKPEPKFEPAPPPGKSAYDSLEQEMANLLGRPSGKS